MANSTMKFPAFALKLERTLLMNKFVRISALVATVLAAPVLAHAQTTGCVSSPENPTAILGVIGGAACAWPSLRTWIGKRKK